MAVVVAFAVFPVTATHYIRVMSDGLATTWTLAAFWAALASRERPRLAWLAGFALVWTALVLLTVDGLRNGRRTRRDRRRQQPADADLVTA